MGQSYIGERFGDYKLVQPLGEGGFASVYLGQEVHKGTPAAVKLPKEQQLHDFINELRRTVLLQHPNIVEILDFSIRTPDNTAFIIMEYAPNGSFRDKYPRGSRVPLDIMITSVKQVASALQYAHDKRVIHRDVKPENLLLNAQNMVLLSDFGIATASRTAMTSNIEQGNIIGTYAYMAPEQLKGRPLPASDQYSLAIMVYEWLCGELPFEARDFYQWRYQHQEVPPPSMRESDASIAPAIEQVVLKALAKKPEERFDRVETFALALERAARGEDVSAVINPPGPTTIKSTQFYPIPTSKPDSVYARTPPNSIEQLFQEGVRAQASGNAEEAFRIWRQMTTTAGVAEKYSTTARNRVRELRTQMIPVRLKQAREASMQGRWSDEIRLWEDLLALEPSAQDLTPLLKSPLTLAQVANTIMQNIPEPWQSFQDEQNAPWTTANNITQSIQERLRIARQNEQSVWMYIGAQQLIHNRDAAAARTQLQMLWQDAPYYGDSAGLSKVLGLPAALNYEQAIVAEQIFLEQKRVEREQQEREKKEQEKLAQEQRAQAEAMKERNKRILTTIMVIVGIIGAIVGIVVGTGVVGLDKIGLILLGVGLVAGVPSGLTLGIKEEALGIVKEDLGGYVAMAIGTIGAGVGAGVGVEVGAGGGFGAGEGIAVVIKAIEVGGFATFIWAIICGAIDGFVALMLLGIVAVIVMAIVAGIVAGVNKIRGKS